MRGIPQGAVFQLIEALKHLPGLGQKSAQRIAFHLLKAPVEQVENLSATILKARMNTRLCSVCNLISDQPVCPICQDPDRDEGLICVVEEPFNVFSVEKSGSYRGKYYVLHGNLSPLKGIGPNELKISGLLSRLQSPKLREVILATSPTTEGNATAHYLSELIREQGKRVSRIALGIPVGADMDYVDAVTIGRALEGRVSLFENGK
jgi:recombination protein RecR